MSQLMQKWPAVTLIGLGMALIARTATPADVQVVHSSSVVSPCLAEPAALTRQ
ncbi:hypothetical protein HQ447_08605 [bacterium]|nr:hypothetical protein [bacterium]